VSVKVIREVYAYSRATNTPWAVMLALADAATDEGVAFPLVMDRCKACWEGVLEQWDDDACPLCGEVTDRRKRTSLTFKARSADSTVRLAIKALEDAGEIEVRKVQRGRKRVNVYRVLCGHLADIEVTYEDLPFKLTEPFSRPPISGGRQEDVQAGDDRRIPAENGPESGPDDRRISGSPIEERPTRGNPPGDPPAAEHLDPLTVVPLPGADDLALSAAALVGQGPATLTQVVTVLDRFKGRDLNSLRVIEPLALQLPASTFLEVAQEAKSRRNVRNEAGLFVHLLRIACAELRLDEQTRIRVAIAEADHRDAESYLRRLLALPNEASADVTASCISRYAPDPAEQARLTDLEQTLRLQPVEAKLRRSIVDTARHYLGGAEQDLHDWLDEWCAENDLDVVLRQELHDLADRHLEAAGDDLDRPNLEEVA